MGALSLNVNFLRRVVSLVVAAFINKRCLAVLFIGYSSSRNGLTRSSGSTAGAGTGTTASITMPTIRNGNSTGKNSKSSNPPTTFIFSQNKDREILPIFRGDSGCPSRAVRRASRAASLRSRSRFRSWFLRYVSSNICASVPAPNRLFPQSMSTQLPPRRMMLLLWMSACEMFNSRNISNDAARYAISLGVKSPSGSHARDVLVNTMDGGARGISSCSRFARARQPT